MFDLASEEFRYRDSGKLGPPRTNPLRVVGNLVTPDGKLAPPDLVKTVGIGTRVRRVFSDVSPGLAIPQWTIDEGATQPEKPWRYPQEWGGPRYAGRSPHTACYAACSGG